MAAISLTTPNEGAVSWAAAINQNFTTLQDYINNRRLPTKYVQGLGLQWVSSTQVNVGSGSCRDSADVVDIALGSSASVTITGSGVNGLDTKTAAGTGSITIALKALSGSGSAFLTDFGIRTASGTYQSTGTAVTGASSHFTSEVAINDLFGDATHGYSRVTQVISDTSITLSAALPNGNAPASTTGSVIETPTIQLGTDIFQLDTIKNNTTATTVAAAAATHTAVSMTIGAAPSVAQQVFLFIFVASGSSGTQPIASTQRTTLLNPGVGYAVGARRVGSVFYQSGAITQFLQHGPNNRRDYVYMPTTNTPFLSLSGGSATLATLLYCNWVVPPTGVMAKVTAEVYLPTGTGSTALSIGPYISGAVYFNQFVETLKAAVIGAPVEVLLDGTQAYYWYLSQASGSCAYITVIGYVEEI